MLVGSNWKDVMSESSLSQTLTGTSLLCESFANRLTENLWGSELISKEAISYSLYPSLSRAWEPDAELQAPPINLSAALKGRRHSFFCQVGSGFL